MNFTLKELYKVVWNKTVSAAMKTCKFFFIWTLLDRKTEHWKSSFTFPLHLPHWSLTSLSSSFFISSLLHPHPSPTSFLIQEDSERYSRSTRIQTVCSPPSVSISSCLSSVTLSSILENHREPTRCLDLADPVQKIYLVHVIWIKLI